MVLLKKQKQKKTLSNEVESEDKTQKYFALYGGVKSYFMTQYIEEFVLNLFTYFMITGGW